MLFEKRRQSEPRFSEKRCRDLSIEDPAQPDTEVAIEESNVVVGPMHHHLDVLVFER